jgi:vitamin B12 transporter
MKKTTLLSLAAISLLTAQPIDLDTITVTTASNINQPLSTATSSMNILTFDDIKEREFISVNEALQSLGRVDIQSSGGLGTQSTVTINGLSGKNVLILIDGISYNDPSTLNNTSPLEHLLLENIERIEVLKGSQSAVWGANASGGVVNIITKKPTKGTHGSLHLKAGSFGTREAGINLSHKDDNYYINLSHDSLKSNSFSSIVPSGENPEDYEADSYTNYTTSLKLGVNINANNHIHALYKMIDATLESDPFGDPDGKYDVKTKDRFYRIGYDSTNDWGDISLYMQQSTFSRNYLDEAWGTPKYDGELKEIGAKFNKNYSNNSFLVVGALHKESRHLNDLNEKYSNSALYLTNSNQWGSTIVTESLRFDNYDEFDNKTTFKVGIKHNINKDLTLSANYGSAYNVPTLYQLYAPASAWGKVGNVDLQPESIKSFDIGLAYHGLSLRYFHNTIEDRIEFTDGYVNSAGESKIKGFEVGYRQSLFENIWLNFSYTRNDAKDANGDEILRVAKDSLKVGGDYYLNNLHVGINYRYIGSKKDMKFNPDFSSEVVENGKYSVVDAIVNYKISEKSKLYIKANNIFDENYQEFYGYGSSPRAVYVGMRVEF